MKNALEQLRDLLAGTADDQAVDEIREEFRDPASGTSMLFAAMKAIADRPFAIDWACLAEAAEELEVESAVTVTGLGSVPLAVARPSASAFLQDKEKTRLEQVRDILVGRVYGKEPQLRAGPAVAQEPVRSYQGERVGADADQHPYPAVELEPFRSYLEKLARVHLDPRLRRWLDPADVVQEALIRSYRAWPDLKNLDRQELKSLDRPVVLLDWLQRILLRTLAELAKRYYRDLQAVDLERSLEPDLDRSASGLAVWPAADQTSPSEEAEQVEMSHRLNGALAALPAPQREAVVLKYIHGWSLQRIGEHLGRTAPAVASLLRGGLEKLRRLLKPKE
jgi:RNA polymerase sigma-70 factor (ECF subfamily)